MRGLISKSVAMREMARQPEDWKGTDEYIAARRDKWKGDKDLIETLPDAKSTYEWTPCSEEVPEPNMTVGNVKKYYLVENEYGDMMVASYNRGSGRTWWEQMYHGEVTDEIVAWMPLPEPYKDKGKEK